MELSEAIQLIQNADIDKKRSQRWADLGCGSGTFTHALAHILPSGSTIYAVDKMNNLKEEKSTDSIITFKNADFENDTLPFADLDGILFANSLHYVQDASSCLRRLMHYLLADHKMFILVEYDSNNANQWVPYPLPFLTMKKKFEDIGFGTIRKLAEIKSKFRQGNLYACQAW